MVLITGISVGMIHVNSIRFARYTHDPTMVIIGRPSVMVRSAQFLVAWLKNWLHLELQSASMFAACDSKFF